MQEILTDPDEVAPIECGDLGARQYGEEKSSHPGGDSLLRVNNQIPVESPLGSRFSF